MRRALPLAVVLLAVAALAQDSEVRSTPKGALQHFLDNAQAGRWREAALALAPKPGPEDESRAKRLKAVFDVHHPYDLAHLSDSPDGNRDDDLPAAQELIGRVPVTGGSEGVRLVRGADGNWGFSAATVGRIDDWYDALPDRFLRQKLPDVLFRVGPRGLFYWQWLALPLFAIVAWGLGYLLSLAARWLIRRVARRTTTTLDDALADRLQGPLTLLFGAIAASSLLGLLLLTTGGETYLKSLLSALGLLAFFWGTLRLVDLGVEGIRASHFVAQRPEMLALLPLGSRLAKLLLAGIAVVVALQKLGYPAASLIAGLGIGGLAFALAAQKTVENLFGSVTLSIDQPFRPGDFVKIEDFTGTIESVGLRSTRIRTLARTIITLPNGRLADMRIETFAARDRVRFNFIMGLVHSTTADQMRAITRDVKALIEGHPRVFKLEPVRVFFINIGPTSLDVELSAWFDTKDWNEFQAWRQELLLEILSIIERHGSRLAFPTTTLQLAALPTSPPPPPVKS